MPYLSSSTVRSSIPALAVDGGFKLVPTTSSAATASNLSHAVGRIYYEGRLDGSRHDFQRFTQRHDFPVAHQELCRTIEAIAERAGTLPVRNRARAQAALSDLLADVQDRDGRLAASGYLPQMYGSSKRDLERIAELLQRDGLPADQRASELEELVEGLAYCATRVIQVIRDARHGLETAQGGICARASQALADLQRSCITDFVQRRIGRDLQHHLPPEQYEMHYVAMLAQRLGLQRTEDMSSDVYLPDSAVSAALVDACRGELNEQVTSVRVARHMASQALESLRHSLQQVLQEEPLDLNLDAHQGLFSNAKRALEQEFGPIPDHSVVRTDIMSGSTLGVHRDTTVLAGILLTHLEKAGALEPASPLRLVGWADEDGRHELLSVRPGLVLLRTNQQPCLDAAPTWESLQRLDEFEVRRPHGAIAPSALPVATREAIALSALPDASDEALGALPPHWVASTDVAHLLCRRLGPEGLAQWIERHPSARRPPVRDPLSAVAATERLPDVLQALDWNDTHALEAYLSWQRADGYAHLHAALSRGDGALAKPWAQLLVRAARMFTGPDLLSAQLGKHSNGRPMQLTAMSQGDETQTRARASFFVHLFRRDVLAEEELVHALRGTDVASLQADAGLCQALERGHSAVLQAYGDAVVDVATLPGGHNLVPALLFDQPSLPNGDGQSALAVAMAKGKLDAIQVWLHQVLDARRQGWLKEAELYLTLGSPDGHGHLVAAQAVRHSVDAQLDLYLTAVNRAHVEHRLTAAHLVSLLQGTTTGRNQVLHALMPYGSDSALRTYLDAALMMAGQSTLTPAMLMKVLGAANDVGVRPLARAMEKDNPGNVTRYLTALMRACGDGRLSRSDLLTLLASPCERQDPAAKRALAHAHGLRAWVNGVLDAASHGMVSRDALRGLFKGRDAERRALLERAMWQPSPESLEVLLDGMLSATSQKHLKPGDLFELITREDGEGRFALHSAMRSNRGEHVQVLGNAVRQAFLAGHFSEKQVLHALSRGYRGREVGLASALIHGDAVHAALAAYADTLFELVKDRAMSASDAGRLLSPAYRPGARPASRDLLRLALNEAVSSGVLGEADRAAIQLAAGAKTETATPQAPSRSTAGAR